MPMRSGLKWILVWSNIFFFLYLIQWCKMLFHLINKNAYKLCAINLYPTLYPWYITGNKKHNKRILPKNVPRAIIFGSNFHLKSSTKPQMQMQVQLKAAELLGCHLCLCVQALAKLANPNKYLSKRLTKCGVNVLHIIILIFIIIL